MNTNEKMIAEREKLIKNFVNNNVSFCQKADSEVLEFIANFLYHGVPRIELETSAESVRSTFRAGYCYYFAAMLQAAFGRGEICWAAPFGHIVWMDENDVPYDIEGVNDSECDYYIPISHIGEGINDFKHVPGGGFGASAEFLDEVIAKYLADQKN